MTAFVWRRIRWPLTTAGAILLFFGFAVSVGGVWDAIAVPHMTPYFADLVAILAAGEAKAAGLDVYQVNPFDPWGRPHVYGPWWLLTGAVGMQVEDAWWLGLILITVFVAVAAAVLSPQRCVTTVCCVLLLASPPVMLGIERCNNDLIVFWLLAAAAWLLTSRARLAVGGGALLLVLAAGLKMYPVAAFPALIESPKCRRLILIGAGISLCAVAIITLWADDYRRALAIAPRPLTIFAYGIKVSALTWKFLPETRIWLMVGLVVSASAMALPLGRRWRDLWNAVPVNSFTGRCFMAGALSLGLCFVATTNYGYRLVLLLLPARLWVAQWGHVKFGALAKWQLVGWLVVCWLPVNKQWLVAAASKPKPGAARELLSAVTGIEQGLTIVLTAALGVCALGWLDRNLRAIVTARRAEQVG